MKIRFPQERSPDVVDFVAVVTLEFDDSKDEIIRLVQRIKNFVTRHRNRGRTRGTGSAKKVGEEEEIEPRHPRLKLSRTGHLKLNRASLECPPFFGTPPIAYRKRPTIVGFGTDKPSRPHSPNITCAELVGMHTFEPDGNAIIFTPLHRDADEDDVMFQNVTSPVYQYFGQF